MNAHLRTLLVPAVSLLLVLALAAPALATPPQTASNSGTNSGVIHCAGFDDNFTDVFSSQATLFFDNAGNPIRITEHVASHSTDTNSVTGLSLHEHDRYAITVNLRTGQLSIAGAPIRMNRKGQGIVIHDTGIVVFDAEENVIFEGGPHEVLNGDEQEIFCRALS